MSYACFPCESIWTTLFKLMMMMSMIRAIRRGEGRADRGLPHASASHADALFWTDTILASSARRVTLPRSRLHCLLARARRHCPSCPPSQSSSSTWAAHQHSVTTRSRRTFVIFLGPAAAAAALTLPGPILDDRAAAAGAQFNREILA